MHLGLELVSVHDAAHDVRQLHGIRVIVQDVRAALRARLAVRALRLPLRRRVRELHEVALDGDFFARPERRHVDSAPARAIAAVADGDRGGLADRGDFHGAAVAAPGVRLLFAHLGVRCSDEGVCVGGGGGVGGCYDASPAIGHVREKKRL